MKQAVSNFFFEQQLFISRIDGLMGPWRSLFQESRLGNKIVWHVGSLRVIDDRLSKLWDLQLLDAKEHILARLRPEKAVSDVLRKLLLFGVLGALSAITVGTIRSPRAVRWLLVGVALAGAAGVAGGIELAQVFLPPHVPDITDVIVETGGAAIGMLVALRWVRQGLLQLADRADAGDDARGGDNRRTRRNG